MLKFIRLLSAMLVVACVASSPLRAAPREDSGVIKQAIEDFLRRQSSSYSGQSSFVIGNIEANNSRPPCGAIDVAMAPGARTIGRSTVVITCRSGANWALYVPVQIKVIADYLASSRALAQGQTIGEGDWVKQTGDLGELPNGVLTDPTQALGRVTAMSIPAGRPLRSDLLRQAPVIQQGQSVKVVSRGAGFEVTNEGRALNNATDGQVVQVRLSTGQVVSGIARNGGLVEITF